VGGRQAIPVTLYTTNPTFIMVNEGIAKDVIYYDQTIGLPLQWERYENDGRMVVKMTFKNIRPNIGLKESLFDAKAGMP
jgi:outer membrane lipoprotein-sorting protein